MKRSTMIATAGAGVLAVALLGAAVPAIAQSTTSTVGAGYGHGADQDRGRGEDRGQEDTGRGGRSTAARGGGAQDATHEDCTTCTAEPGSGDPADLGTDGAAELMTWIEEEKVAYDLYLAFADMYDARQFERIAEAEANHMDAVRTLLATYGLDDPTVGAEAGEFDDPELQELYDTLLAQGSESEDEAFAVGRAVELDDIDLIEQAIEDVSAADVQEVLAQQLEASTRHLAAFGG